MFKKIVALFFVGMLWSLPAVSNPPADDDGYCTHKYEDLIDFNMIVCSRTTISDRQMDILKKIINKTVRLYPFFVAKYNIRYQTLPTQLVGIVFLTNEEINNPVIFPGYREGRVVGRYYPDAHMLYLTAEALLPGSTILAHELVHCLNEYNAVVDNEKDEIIAYAFEKYYTEMP